ncbi:MAG: hypothetical protein HYX76_05200 [Acidobacteria bacterium]|nr:hypothetical protein [Acidobacteriota bacterium]
MRRPALIVTFVLTVAAPATLRLGAMQPGRPAQASVPPPGAPAARTLRGGEEAPHPTAPSALTGQQYARLVIRNALLINGRRGTPTEGPVDIVIDRDTIADIIPTDGVSMRNYGPGWKRPEVQRWVPDAMCSVPGPACWECGDWKHAKNAR